MIKKDVFVVGIGLGGSRVGCDFQQKNYDSYLINGSLQDNKTLPDAKNMLVLEGYDGLAGDRSLAFEALKNNKDILQKVMGIEEKVILLVATGGGTTGSGCITHLANIICGKLPDKIVCACLMMPRSDEPIQKRLNAYNAAKELMEIPEMGALIFISNEACDSELNKINCNGVQREHNKKLNNGLPILHKVPPKRDYGRYFCILAEKGGTSHGGLTEKLSPFFYAQKQEVNAYGR